VAAGGLHGPRCFEDILLGIDGAGAAHHNDAPAPYLHLADADDCVVWVDFAACELVGLADTNDGVDTLEDTEFVDQLWVDMPKNGHDVTLFTVYAVVLEAQFPYGLLYADDLIFRCVGLHDDDHDVSPCPR